MPTVKVPRLYTGDDGWSHWDEVEVDLAHIAPNGIGASADIVPTQGVIWRQLGSSDRPGEYHRAPAKQYVPAVHAPVTADSPVAAQNEPAVHATGAARLAVAHTKPTGHGAGALLAAGTPVEIAIPPAALHWVEA
mgnify:CR=1 FL=1